MNRTKIVALAAVGLAVAAIGTVHAQPWNGPRHHATAGKFMMQVDYGRHGKGGGHHGGKWMCGKARYIDGRLAFLKTELKITAEQEQVWNDYADTVRANAKSMKEQCEEMKEAKGEDKRPPLPERLDLRTKMMEARLDALRAKSKALKPLYDALSDDQKKTADELIRL
jgi:LTXXQ motif family protein